MITYKYCVYDDEHKIADSCFDTFEEAFDYAQDGLVTFIEEVPYIDGVECEDEIEIVWS